VRKQRRIAHQLHYFTEKGEQGRDPNTHIEDAAPVMEKPSTARMQILQYRRPHARPKHSGGKPPSLSPAMLIARAFAETHPQFWLQQDRYSSKAGLPLGYNFIEMIRT